MRNAYRLHRHFHFILNGRSYQVEHNVSNFRLESVPLHCLFERVLHIIFTDIGRTCQFLKGQKAKKFLIETSCFENCASSLVYT